MSYPLKPVCVACQCFYRPEKNGYMFMEGMPDKRGEYAEMYGGNIRGKRHPEVWSPYKLWRGDLWKCPDCGHEIVVGFASRPSAEHYQPGFAKEVELAKEEMGKDIVQINDC